MNRSSADFRKNLATQTNTLINGAVARGEVAGAVALFSRGDNVHVETAGMSDIAGAKAIAKDTIFRIASMTKPVTAAAAMILIENGLIELDAPVDPWLPELANRRVLRSLESALDDTVAAARPVTVRDLLTFRFGLGAVMARRGSCPIQTAMDELGISPGPDQLPFTPDEYMARIGRLPLIHQPGERWMYHTGADVLAVLIARAAGMPLERFLRERLFLPLGMHSTGYSVPGDARHRLSVCYARDSSDRLQVWDMACGGRYDTPPAFPNALLSTADDYHAFARMLIDQGRCQMGRVLGRLSTQLMMSDQITPAQKANSLFYPGFWDNKGWGFGGAVITRRDGYSASPGRYGWDGGFGTSFIADPREDIVAILLIQRLMRSPDDTELSRRFFDLVYRAIDD